LNAGLGFCARDTLWQVAAVAERLCDESGGSTSLPSTVVCASALSGAGVDDVRKALEAELRRLDV
jgi:hypothetical protein